MVHASQRHDLFDASKTSGQHLRCELVGFVVALCLEAEGLPFIVVDESSVSSVYTSLRISDLGEGELSSTQGQSELSTH